MKPTTYLAGPVFHEDTTFPDGTLFGPYCDFGWGCTFGNRCKFAEGCDFGPNATFGNDCEFAPGCKFDPVVAPKFGERCRFDGCRFPDFIHFGPRSHFKDCTFSLRNAFGWACTYEGSRFGLIELLLAEQGRIGVLLDAAVAAAEQRGSV